MSLLSSGSSSNRVIESALSVSYFRRTVQGTWQGVSFVGGVVTDTYYMMYEYHRVARKTYKYVGLTEEAAKAQAASLISTYTRTVRLQNWDATQSENEKQGTWVYASATATEMSAYIAARHVAGSMWEVCINVNEDSTYLSRTDIPRTYSVIFSDERARGYDGESET